MTSGGNKSNDLPDHQMTKFYAHLETRDWSAQHRIAIASKTVTGQYGSYTFTAVECLIRLMKKLNSLQHLIRTMAAKLQN